MKNLVTFVSFHPPFQNFSRWTKCKVTLAKRAFILDLTHPSVHPRFNTSRGKVFLSDFDMDDVQLLKEELCENYVSEIERAEFIKIRN